MSHTSPPPVTPPPGAVPGIPPAREAGLARGPHEPAGRVSRLAPHLPALGLYLLFVTVFLAPVWGGPGVLMPGEPTSDLADHVWGYAWVARSLGAGQLPWQVTDVRFPDPAIHFFPDLLGALASLPFQALLGVPRAFALIAGLNLLLSALAAYLLGWRWTGARGPALLAGTVFAFSSYALSNLHNGTSEYACTFFLPLFWLSLETALRQGGARRVLLAAGAWFGATLGALYYGLFAGLLAVGVLAVEAYRSRRQTTSSRASDASAGVHPEGDRSGPAPLEASAPKGAGSPLFQAAFPNALPGLKSLLQRFAAVLGLYLLGALPLAWLWWLSLSGPGALVSLQNAPGWRPEALPVTDLLTFLAPFPYYFPDMARDGNLGIQHVNSLGYVALGLAGVGVWRRGPARGRLGLCLFWGLLMLGPQLTVHGNRLSLMGIPLLLPWGWLSFPGSPLRLVHHPYRLVAVGMLLLAGLAAWGLHRLGQGRKPWARGGLGVGFSGFVMLEVCLASPARFPIPTTPMQPPPLYQALAQSADPGQTPGAVPLEPGVARTLSALGKPKGILDFPPQPVYMNRQYLLWSTVHGRPIPYAPNTFISPSVLTNPFFQYLLACLEYDPHYTRGREGPMPVPRVETTYRQAVAGAKVLREQGFSWLVVHHPAMLPAHRAALETAVNSILGQGAPAGAGAQVFVFPEGVTEAGPVP